MSKPKHHVRQEVCSSRAPYRDGRKPTAVKVYTIHHESKYLLIQGVAAVGATNELVKLFESVGDIEEHKILDDYPSEQFTEVHLIKYRRIQSARFAKRKFDDWSFYGGVLHVCYAPEFETIKETREKLRERRRVIEAKTRQYKSDGTYSNSISQTSQSNNSLVEETGDEGNQHGTAATENGYSYRIEGTSQNYDAIKAHDTHYSEHIQEQQYTNTNIQHYGVHGVPPYNIKNNASQYYGGQSVSSQPNVHTYDGQVAQNINNYSGRSISDNGSAEQICKKPPQNQTSLSYGEQVVLQARSLQNYGKSFKLNRENRQKRLNQTEGSSAVNENSTQNMTVENEERLSLPPPPKQMRSSDTGFRKSQRYNSARVPSAQATFPANFDARTDRHRTEPENSMLKDPKCLESGLNEINEKVEDKEEENKIVTKTMQEKVEENLKNKNMLVKDFSKKGTVPKFIPRQAQIRKKLDKTSDKSKNDAGANKTNELNQEIRRNAFKLGKAQGPADLGPSTSNESLDPKEKSVIESMLEIRRKLTKVKD